MFRQPLNKTLRGIGITGLWSIPITFYAYGAESNKDAKATISLQHSPTEGALFRCTPRAGYKVNEEAPWGLTVFASKTPPVSEKPLAMWGKDQFKKELPGFKVTLPPSSQTYSFVYFLCSTDKGQCYREEHQGVITAKP
jgi:Tfp pilus assembly protein PilV